PDEELSNAIKNGERMRRPYLKLGLGIVATVLIICIAWGMLRRQPTTIVGALPLRVGVLRHESSLPFYIAQALGFFKARGLNVELVELPPGDHLPALLSNRVDLISPTSFPTLFGLT